MLGALKPRIAEVRHEYTLLNDSWQYRPSPRVRQPAASASKLRFTIPEKNSGNATAYIPTQGEELHESGTTVCEAPEDVNLSYNTL